MLSSFDSNNTEFLLSSVFVVVGQCHTGEVPQTAQTGRLCTSLVWSGVSNTLRDIFNFIYIYIFSFNFLSVTTDTQ